MYGYNTGNNERNDHEVKKRIDTIHSKISRKSTRLSRAPTVDFNHQMLKKKQTLQVDLDKVKKEAKELLEKNGPGTEENDLLFEKQSVSIFRIYCHLFECIDWFFLVFAIIGSIGSGISMPIMSYILSQVYTDVGNTSEMQYSPEAIAMMMEAVEDTMDDQVKRQLIYGAISFVCTFFSVFFLVFNR